MGHNIYIQHSSEKGHTLMTNKGGDKGGAEGEKEGGKKCKVKVIVFSFFFI